MKGTFENDPGTPFQAASRGVSLARLVSLASAARQAYLQVIGIPDYERYQQHMAAKHPGDPLLSRREFYAWSIDRKYGRGGPRCC